MFWQTFLAQSYCSKHSSIPPFWSSSLLSFLNLFPPEGCGRNAKDQGMLRLHLPSDSGPASLTCMDQGSYQQIVPRSCLRMLQTMQQMEEGMTSKIFEAEAYLEVPKTPLETFAGNFSRGHSGPHSMRLRWESGLTKRRQWSFARSLCSYHTRSSLSCQKLVRLTPWSLLKGWMPTTSRGMPRSTPLSKLHLLASVCGATVYPTVGTARGQLTFGLCPSQDLVRRLIVTWGSLWQPFLMMVCVARHRMTFSASWHGPWLLWLLECVPAPDMMGRSGSPQSLGARSEVEQSSFMVQCWK